MMQSSRFRLGEMPAILHWDGAALHGVAAARSVIVTVPLRLVAVRCERLPPAAPAARRAAARLKAVRAFAPLGAVSVEALMPEAAAGEAPAILLALPRAVLDAIRAAVAQRKQMLTAVRIAELAVPVPVGGVVAVHGEACLVAARAGKVEGLAALGPVGAPGYDGLLARERLRLGVGADAPALPAVGPGLDFLQPTLLASEPLLQRRGMRVGLLAAGLAALLLIALGLAVVDALAARREAQAEAARLRPLATALAARRAELAEVAPWFDARPSPTLALAVLVAAMPPLGGDEELRLVRVRQVAGEDAVVEAGAGDRAQMMAFLDRLRRDPRVASATIRSSRNPSKEARGVVFELVLRLSAGGGHAAS